MDDRRRGSRPAGRRLAHAGDERDRICLREREGDPNRVAAHERPSKALERDPVRRTVEGDLRARREREPTDGLGSALQEGAGGDRRRGSCERVGRRPVVGEDEVHPRLVTGGRGPRPLDPDRGSRCSRAGRWRPRVRPGLGAAGSERKDEPGYHEEAESHAAIIIAPSEGEASRRPSRAPNLEAPSCGTVLPTWGTRTMRP